MRGEFMHVWTETKEQIWSDLFAHELAPSDLYCELYREITQALKRPRSAGDLAGIIDDRLKSQEEFERIGATDFSSELAVIRFLEGVFDILEEQGGDPLSNLYVERLEAFIEKYSLRYDLRRPCALCPTLPGVFSNLMRDLRILTGSDTHLDGLMKDFDNAVRDLRLDCSEGRIKTCIQKQVNLLEALGRACPGITETNLGKICNQLDTWPHAALKSSLKNIYGFASDYPGIRHGGTPANALRDIDMRDMIAMSILLAGFVPYLTNQLDIVSVYGGV